METKLTRIETILNEIKQELKDELNVIKTILDKIEKNTRENTDVAQKMSRYTAVLDFAENKLTNSGLLSYFINPTLENNYPSETEESNSDFDD